MKLLIAGGGTGGHVFPALAIAREWMSRGSDRDVVLVGTQRGIEMKLVPQAGLPLETLRVAGLKGKGGVTLLKNLGMLGSGLSDAFGVLKRHAPVAAFGVGGYAAGPMLLATWLKGIPNVIFEPNAEPGFTNKVLARFRQAYRHRVRSLRQVLGRQSASNRLSRARRIFRHPASQAGTPTSFAGDGRQSGRLAHQSHVHRRHQFVGGAKK